MPRSLPSCVRWRPVPWSFFPKDGACQKFLSETTIQFNAWKQTLIVTSVLFAAISMTLEPEIRLEVSRRG